MSKVVKLALQPERFERPLQFDFFESQDARISNTIAVWDVAPRFVFRDHKDLRDGQYLKTIDRSFTYGGYLYRLTLNPARFRRNGKQVEEYPGEREQLVEEVIRRLAVTNRRLDLAGKDEVGVTFRVWDVRQELKRTKHVMAHVDVVEALQVLSKSIIEIYRVDAGPNGEKVEKLHQSPTFPQVRFADKGAEDTSIAVQFNWFVAEALKCLDFRQIDYETLMNMSGPIERWLFKKLTHDTLYNGGDLLIHEVKASEIIDGCGLTICTRIRDTLRRIPAAVEQLKAHGVIDEYVATDIKDGRKKVDIAYKLIASRHFMDRINESMRRGIEDRRVFREITGEDPVHFIPSDRAKRTKLERMRSHRSEESEVLRLPLPEA